uniref:Uncharacterized protein n=1 Tax=Arundo donax TaxID=35708 RepID=A0A0A9EM77_ARUDO
MFQGLILHIAKLGKMQMLSSCFLLAVKHSLLLDSR